MSEDLRRSIFAPAEGPGGRGPGAGRPEGPPGGGGNNWFAPPAGAQTGGHTMAPPSSAGGPFKSAAAAAVPPQQIHGSIGGGMAPPRAGGGSASFGDEVPLLEELGVNFDHIRLKTKAVLLPFRPIDAHILDDADIAGPLVFCLALGFCLLFSGKVHFGYIIGFAVFGCVGIYTVVNLMAQGSQSAARSVDIYRIFSAVGYCLLPIVLMSTFTIVLDLRGWFGTVLAVLAIFWCTFTATRFFEVALGMKEQRYLIAYPVFLVYACFALITIF